MSALWPPQKPRKVGVINDDSVIGGLNVREFESTYSATGLASCDSHSQTILRARMTNAKCLRNDSVP
jgi:hypothetical protein